MSCLCGRGGERKPFEIFKNVSMGNAFDFEDFEDFQKCFQGECTSADDGGSSVDCGAGIYTCLIARTSNLPPHHIIGQFAGYHVLIILNVKARPQESLRKHSTAGVESLGCLRAKDSPALWRHFLMWAPLSLPPFKLLLFSVISFRNCSPKQN